MNTETVPQHGAKQISSSSDNRIPIIFSTGLATIVFWIWAGILLLSPVQATLDGWEHHGDCGTVVTFDRAEESKVYSEHWAVACEGAVDLRAREALGLGLASVPITALWVYLASRQPRRASELKRAEIFEPDSAEVEQTEADTAES